MTTLSLKKQSQGSNFVCPSAFDDLKSFYSLLYIDIQERLKECCPEIQWIERYFGQDRFNFRAGVAFPAILIDFPDTTYTGEEGSTQFCEAIISIRLLYSSYSQASAYAPDTARADAMGFFELENKIVTALHGWTPPRNYCQSLVRVRAESEYNKRTPNDNRNGVYDLRILTFSTCYEEDFT